MSIYSERSVTPLELRIFLRATTRDCPYKSIGIVGAICRVALNLMALRLLLDWALTFFLATPLLRRCREKHWSLISEII